MTVKQRNMTNHEMKLAIRDELFHPIVNATKHVTEEMVKELAPVKKALAVLLELLLISWGTKSHLVYTQHMGK